MSEALIFASTNPQFDDRLLIELQDQYIKIPSSNLGRTCCVQKLFLTFRTIFVHNMFSPCSAKRRASDKDLPVTFFCCFLQQDGSSKLFVNTAKHDFRTGRHNLQIVMCVRKLRFWKYYIIKTFIKTFIKNAYNFTILVTNSL